MIGFDLSAEQQRLEETARRFAAEEIIPVTPGTTRSRSSAPRSRKGRGRPAS